MFFLLVGFFLVLLIRWQLAYPGDVVPFVGRLLGETNAPGGSLSPEFYNQLGAMHGTIMVFLGIVPLAFGAFGNYVVPLQIGAPDMAFPRLNALSYWLRADALARRHAAADLLVAPRRDELHRHHHSAARAGHDVVPSALLRVV